MNRLIVVSNRVALPNQTATGGLASAMRDALRERGGLWFGWSGKIAKHTAGQLHHLKDGEVEYATIDLSKEDHDHFYDGYANRTLWPLLHYRPDLVDYNRGHLAGYLRVNTVFADRLADLIEPNDMIWINDYHLIPLASMLRERGVRNRIGFFLHTPLPAAGLLIALPQHRELLETLSSYDLIGLHTARDLRALEDYFLHEAHAVMRPGHRMRASNGHIFRAGVFPIGIDTHQVAEMAKRALAEEEEIGQLRASLDDRALIIGVDRLDYSKGLPERFQAYERLLERAPELHRKVTLLQIAPPSRSTVPEYRQIRRELERSAGHINGLYAAPDWVPVRYVNNSYPHSVLSGYYRTARVGLITPLRDGMNLVAKEYVASQNPKDPGVLVLSRFAGAAEELTQALLVNPADTEEVTDALERALKMPLKERRNRWHAMMEILQKHDLTAWRKSFLDALAA
ncbi:alpha,alpha-trehalose-phosphate synthase (UDP-forming) [Dyella sp. GSA-30]|uniref:alpha,alpha-trehalose-phosphate synthase (UDP-forming) n=1 Tax=Dyella sp. GSA-30 TaxID=2994496 RepID=UPI00248F67A0|nr:alpha,alpha-trehalose-phosphate synthase (UDP-forming) [Dyella sp. GSA-30]BDU23124.1 alpha,alpha-trehalose-phosphate synthase (UDP-forming) [Dyella sp. GSA-30]